MDPSCFADEPSKFHPKEKQDFLLIEGFPGNDLSNILPDGTSGSDVVVAQANNHNDEKMALVDESGTKEDRMAFISELQSFYAERDMVFKVPKSYGQPLNCLKLWKVVNNLGGYEQVELSNLWRKVGDTFKPPKTCKNMRCTFRNFYMKILWEYEKHVRQIAAHKGVEVICPTPANSDEEMNLDRLENRDRSLGTGSKRKRENRVEQPGTVDEVKQLKVSTVDVGLSSEWVKINVQATKFSFEVYVLVPGLQPEELRIQAIPSGRMIITAQPQDPSDPWGIGPFKKIVLLPGRIDPSRMVATLSVVGTMRISLPFEESKDEKELGGRILPSADPR